MDVRFAEAVATLIGVTIGAGVLGIPYVFAQSGVVVGLGHLFVIGVAIITLNLYLGEVVLRTKGRHQLTGYAERYLGRNGKRAMTAVMIVSIYGAMTAYTIGVGQALASMFPAVGAFAHSILFYAVGAGIIFIGLAAVQRSELLMSGIVVATIIGISAFALGSDKFSTAHLVAPNMANLFLPYGVVLFAMLGSVAIPEMRLELGSRKKLLKRAIVIGGILSVALYGAFAVAVVGTTGAGTSQVATIGLGELFGRGMALFANVFAVFAMATSFLALGLGLKEMYHFDYKIGKNLSWMLAAAVPVTAFVLGVNEFIPLIGTLGVVTGGAMGIMIVLMHDRARTLGEMKPAYTITGHHAVSIALIGMFVLGVINLLF